MLAASLGGGCILEIIRMACKELCDFVSHQPSLRLNFLILKMELSVFAYKSYYDDLMRYVQKAPCTN